MAGKCVQRKRTTGPGYLYAVFAGFWPRPDGSLELHIKLGSTRDSDPVSACGRRYNTFVGRVHVLWVAPSADAYRDERHQLHAAFEDQRTWDNRELFTFHSMDEFMSAIAVFGNLHAHGTAHENERKPPPVTDLDRPSGLKRKQRQAEVEERKKLRDEHAEAAKQEKVEMVATRDASQEALLSDLIAKECRTGKGLRVIAEHFNARARELGAQRGIGPAMGRFGYPRRTLKIDGRAGVQCYIGLESKVM